VIRKEAEIVQLEQEKEEVGEELNEVKETLSSKQKMLKKVRLEVVGLQARLKKPKRA
jgi:hypothetical protein